jgi:hypothetical protein
MVLLRKSTSAVLHVGFTLQTQSNVGVDRRVPLGMPNECHSVQLNAHAMLSAADYAAVPCTILVNNYNYVYRES